MELGRIASKEEWKEFEREITKRFGVDANVFNTDGIRITDFKNWTNELCPAIKATDKGQAFICAVAHMNIAAEAKNTKKPVISECDAGIMKMVVPIFDGEDFLGAVGACGVLKEDGEIDPFYINKVTGIDYDKAEELAKSVKSISEEKAKELEGFIVENIERIMKKTAE